jgi:aryl-alcohol dehydrogenase-like predicted oxidoreductase
LLQGNVIGRLPHQLRTKFEPRLTDAQRALQFVRSAPGLTAALTGMSHAEHVEQNMALRHVPPMTNEAWQAVFSA